jgi:hypothetical protein
MSHADGQPYSPRQVLLGFFILFQLVFLLLSNLFGFIKQTPDASDPHKKLINRVAPGLANQTRHGWNWSNEVSTIFDRYMELTGQHQGWQLFSPGVGKATGFPAIVMLFDDPTAELDIPDTMFTFDETNGFNLVGPWKMPTAPGPSLRLARAVGTLAATYPLDALALHYLASGESSASKQRIEVLLSDNEPEDINTFIRFGKCRLRRYEWQFYLHPQPEEDEAAAVFAFRLGQRTRELVHNYGDAIVEYLRWRLRRWQVDHPDAPAPTQLVLMQRQYRIHGPAEAPGWDGPFVIPLVRLQPNAARNDSLHLLEAFDFSERRFVAVSK